MKKWLLRGLGILAALLVIAFLAFRVPDTDPDEMRAKYAGEPSQFLALADGREIHLRDEGPRDAPAIILLHGSNADLHTWQPWAEMLSEDYRVIRYDQRGHGLTGPAPDDDYTLGGFVSDVTAVADELDLATFTLAGNSMGGWIAAGYAIEHPGRLDALVLVDASGAPVRREGGGNLAFTLAGMPVIGDVMSQLLPRSLIARSLSQSVSNQDIVTDEAIDRYWEMARYPGNRSATRKRFSVPRTVYDAETISGVRVPTLVMWGKEDTLVPYAAGQWYAEHLPDATLVAYDGIGHIPMEEAPERSATDLMVWLSEMRLGPPGAMEPQAGEAVLTP
ncbi:alpha/beta hydrolase [Qipengyuania aquimaris]|uniref:alpha/beta fold hydrolase n=1 Tax=Qipengyuania aquimaris TaxID=255984 RepID=UPI0028F71116|nr:alpha/beta hydrolase [Qipengyuania aquimaris]